MKELYSADQIKAAFAVRKNFRSLFNRGSDHYPVLDGFRAISILWIFAFHLFTTNGFLMGEEGLTRLHDSTPFLFYWIFAGDKAVDIFFIASGFLISGLLFKELDQTQTINLKSFYWRRFLRLSPVYWTILLLYFLAQGPFYEMIWTNVLYVNNLIPFEQMPMNWTWSLAVEEQFYLVFPLFLFLVWFKVPQKIGLLLALFVLSGVIRFVVLYTNPDLWEGGIRYIFTSDASGGFLPMFNTLYINLHTRFGAFVCGILASYLYFYHRDSLRAVFTSRYSLPLTLLGLMASISFCYVPVFDVDVTYSREFELFYLMFHRHVFSIGITIVLLAALFPHGIGRLLSRFLSARFWTPIAQLSYSTYIIHVAVVFAVMYGFKMAVEYYGIAPESVTFYAVIALGPVCYLLSASLATLLYLLIEKPFMNLRGGFRPRLKAENEAASQIEQQRGDTGNLDAALMSKPKPAST